MLSIKQILVPVDFSDRCLGMMRYVRSVARAYGSQVTLLHVVNPFYTIPPTGFSGPAMIQIAPTILAEKSKELDQFAIAELEGIPVRRFVHTRRYGQPDRRGWIGGARRSDCHMPTHTDMQGPAVSHRLGHRQGSSRHPLSDSDRRAR